MTLIPNWKQAYKFYVVILAAFVAVFNYLVANQADIQALIPLKYLPYWNTGFAITGIILRVIQQPAVSTAPQENPK